MMHWYETEHVSGWGYALMTISMVAFWALVLAGIVLLVRYLGRADRPGGARPSDGPSPEQLLAERFARGEIDEEEYRHRLDVVRAGGALSRR